jgi:hypothetical protein
MDKKLNPFIDETLEVINGRRFLIKSFSGKVDQEIRHFISKISIESFEIEATEKIKDVKIIDYKYIITSGNSVELFGSLKKDIDFNLAGALIYVGSNNKSDIFVATYLPYKDKRIFCFNEPFCNYKTIEIQEIEVLLKEVEKKVYELEK